jgi:aminotransferase
VSDGGVARRLLPASGIRRIFDRAAALERDGREVLHLEVGQPDFALPPGAAAGAAAALDAGQVRYIANRGLASLRAVLAEDVARATGRAFDPERELIVTSGASEAIAMAMLALLGPGDEAIVPEPAWNHYAATVQLAGAVPVTVALDPARGFALDPDAVAAAITPRTRLLVVNTPGNPTGAVQPAAALEAVAALAREHDLFVIADEVYDDYVFAGEHVSIARWLGDSERLLYVNSASKRFGMTGWRAGWVAAAAETSDALNRVHQYLTVCGVPFVQAGLERALVDPGRGAYRDALRAAFAQRRAVWLDALRDVPGVELVAPAGAFYLFPRLRLADGATGEALCARLLDERGLALVPGGVFGGAFADHVRISYGGATETQRVAAARLAEALRDGR